MATPDEFSTPPKLESKLGPISPQAISLESFTLVSMNIAGCVPSKDAPRHWTLSVITDAMRTEILKNNPDIIALQECPGGVEWAETVFGDSYKALGAKYSHADQVVLLVRKEIDSKYVEVSGIPAVVGELKSGDRKLLVASVHLQPFLQGSILRKMQMEELAETAGSIPLIVAGDTNMRETEDETMEDELNLYDAWKLAGAEAKTKFSWDTIDHGDSFNRYYGDSTRQYNARYDRIYFNKIVEVQVPSFELIANKPLTSKFHFLSDHFGLNTKLDLQWKK